MAEPQPLADEGKRAALHFVLLALSPSFCSVESAPLLRGGENEQAEHPSLYHKLAEITSQPLTAISKLLLAVCLFLLLLSSIFVGLFAGAQHKINKIRHTPVPEPTTVSVTATQELPVTLTETEISTSVAATTIVSITTAPAPPIPTPDPRTVREEVPYTMKGVANPHYISSFPALLQGVSSLLLRSFHLWTHPKTHVKTSTSIPVRHFKFPCVRITFTNTLVRSWWMAQRASHSVR
jgi:hypothetical protein